MALANTLLNAAGSLVDGYIQKKKYQNGIYDVKKANITPRANQYASQMNDAVSKLNNIEKFNYNQKEDPLYQQYAEMYQKNAKLAMQDTVGQATALTGGYGSSYAETAGQAMYNQAMNGLNDKALDLYNASLNAYNSYADLAAKQAGAATSAFNADQNAIDTEVSAAQWNADYEEQQRQYAADMAWKDKQFKQEQLEFGLNYALNAAKTGYDMYADTRDFDYNKGIDERNFNYQQERDRVSDEQYASDLAYKYAGLQQDQAQFEAQQKYQYAALAQDKSLSDADRAYKYAALKQDKAQYDANLAYQYAAQGITADGRLTAAERERLAYQYGKKANSNPVTSYKDNSVSKQRKAELDKFNMPYRTEAGYAEAVADMIDKGTIDDNEAIYLLKSRGFSDKEIEAMFE